MPEERNRIAVDRVGALLLCPDERSAATLRTEGAPAGIEVVGDVMADACFRLAPIAREPLAVLGGSASSRAATSSRPSTARRTSEPERLRRIVDGLGRHRRAGRSSRRIRARASRLGDAARRTCELVEPLGYLDMAALCSQARVIVTDSGGLQKEAYWYGVPCVTARPSTEWVDTVEAGANVLVDDDPEALAAAVAAARMPDDRPPLYGDGQRRSAVSAAFYGPRGRGSD